ncbi:hypothetical protein Dsin_022761 [Dipteronia sinensis]|uniref:Uncharacterized protein n=1 Tax=Dipteronia sinensis TaxID=43782 RepID=A0AAE0E088_9ROSI|nr:hypothetical protein Dsin_022761 [Dipteronia sinensis]
MVKSMVNKVKPGMLFIQESKLKVFDSKVISSLGGGQLTRGVGVDSEGASGGLLTLWSEEFFTVDACISNKSCIILASSLNKIKKDIVFCNVYAVSLESDRRDLWDFIMQSQQTFLAPWESEAWPRLDRYLISPIILMWFQNLIQRGLNRSLSYHNPILIEDSVTKWGPSPFRFMNWWLEENDMMKDAIDGWTNCVVKGSKGFSLFVKAKAVKMKLKNWARSSKLTVVQPSDLEEKLGSIDREVADSGWSDILKQDRSKFIEDLWKCLRREEQMWRQKSMISWLREMSDPTSLKMGIFNFFKNHFQKEYCPRPMMVGINLNQLSEEDKQILEASFTLEEIWLALSNCDGNKAPSQDGLNLNLLKLIGG